MGETTLQRAIRERQRDQRRAIGGELRRTRLDTGLSLRGVGGPAGVDPSHLARAEAGNRDLSLGALVAVAAAMGHDVSFRLYPSSGPRVRDRIQVRMLEALLDVLSARWIPRLEVPVYRPVHGVIDVVLQDQMTADVVAGEAHSAIRTVDQQVRWAEQKADALPSARGWPWADTIAQPQIGRLLLLRSTAATRELVRTLPHNFRAAYPAATRDAYAALTSTGSSWPGAAILWVVLDGSSTTVLHGPPRGIAT